MIKFFYRKSAKSSDLYEVEVERSNDRHNLLEGECWFIVKAPVDFANEKWMYWAFQSTQEDAMKHAREVEEHGIRIQHARQNLPMPSDEEVRVMVEKELTEIKIHSLNIEDQRG